MLPIAAVVALAAAVAPPTHDQVANGDHWRIKTESRGIVHAWRPAGYDSSSAGVVVYVHGYYSDVDTAFTRHRLAEQFDASGRNALFIIPEAPASSDEEVIWTSLGDLLRTVAAAGIRVPRGPLVVIGHSAAYRTVVNWLDYPPLRGLILLDALYGNEEDYVTWLEERRGHSGRRMTIVANDTVKWAEPFAKRIGNAQTVAKIPESIGTLSAEQRDARVLYLRSQFGHMDIVVGGKTLPLILERTRLRALKPPSAVPASP